MYFDVRRNINQCSVKILLVYTVCMFNYRTVYAQHYEAKSIIYNTVLGGVSACVGGIINKKKEEKWYKIFVKKFAYGAAGGMLMYSGKKLNTLITNNNNLAFGWLSRGVFSAGVSIIENVSAGDKAWTAWHYDIGFIRFEYNFAEKKFQPKLMPSAFGATLFIAINSKLDLKTSLSSGTLTLRTSQISYQPGLTGSTVTNAILFNDTLTTGRVYYDIYAHEMVHSFQFSEFSGVNHFFKPFTNKWETNSTLYRKVHRWTYGDLNHEMMLLNYFIIQGGSRGNYCRNFLENEAEFLTVGRGACAQ